MASLVMAKAVLDHAETYCDTDRWYLITDFWSVEEILEELNIFEETNESIFLLDTGAIAHFHAFVNPQRGWPH